MEVASNSDKIRQRVPATAAVVTYYTPALKRDANGSFELIRAAAGQIHPPCIILS